jgi:RHS repeat-associated protein
MIHPDSHAIRFVHGPRGIQAMEDSVGGWTYPVQDGLGSVRSEVDDALSVDSMQHYAPYGAPFGTAGTFAGPFGFTGEQVDANELVYLRARHYAPELGVFASLDPVENINRYGYVDNNPVSRVDSDGKCWVNSGATQWQQAQCSDAWQAYTQLITDTMVWDQDVRIAVSREARYWGNLTYTEFIAQWNSDRVPANVGSNNTLQASGAAIGALALDPLPGDELLALCVAAIAAVAAAAGGTRTLPRRQPLDFSNDRVDDDNIPIPFPLDRDIPNDYRGVFDVALGRGGTLSNFASFFVDRPTVPFGSWPDWMIYDPPGKPGDSPTGNWLPLMSGNDEVVAGAVETALMAWALVVPTGRIKFNLEGLDRTDPAPHRITLSELRRVSTNPLLASKTRYFFYYPAGGEVGIGGVARELNPFEVASELMRLTSLM